MLTVSDSSVMRASMMIEGDEEFEVNALDFKRGPETRAKQIIQNTFEESFLMNGNRPLNFDQVKLALQKSMGANFTEEE